MFKKILPLLALSLIITTPIHAVSNVINQCSSDHDDMFCRPEAVSCKTY
ncbi:hypothetical protein NHN17_15380 [Photobacterium sp. ZSDE20]|uniref:Uncharacterized protein n=1 Tax=Photobacterium pectinilyticum TaxID=2906793 RepID=A0ABT1N4F3_9GAMM|nr:hypothetical protein [Photobacterium sp. ZSDE20]MCQ1059432.1 hypothetical protein [Photobacterium sp. ZSDE20]